MPDKEFANPRDHVADICTRLVLSGELPTAVKVHKMLAEERGSRNPSMTTVTQGMKEWEKTHLATLAETRAVFGQHSATVTEAVHAMLDVVYQDSLGQAKRSFDEMTRQHLADIERANAAAREAQHAQLAAKALADNHEARAKELTEQLNAAHAAAARIQAELEAEHKRRLDLEAELARERTLVAEQVAEMRRAGEAIEHARKQLMVEKDQERTARQAAEAAAERARVEAGQKDITIASLRTDLADKSAETGRLSGRLEETQRELADVRVRLTDAIKAKLAETVPAAPPFKAKGSPARRAMAARRNKTRV